MTELPDYIIFSIEANFDTFPITIESFVKATKVAKKVSVTFAGYDNDPRELWDIPEVTAYLREFTTVAKEAGANFARLDDISKALLLHACGKAQVMRKSEGGATFHITGEF